MKPDHISLFRCPKTGESLTLLDTKYSNNKIQSGWLISEISKLRYPIINYIPRFVTEPNYADSFGFQWNEFPKTQLDSYTGISISEKRFFDTTNFNKNLQGELILEVGSGAGRFTEIILKTGATLYSCDYSDAVEANYKNNGTSTNLFLFKASVYDLPFHKKSFSKVICIGVIQHTPNPEESFYKLAEMVKDGGELVIDTYNKRLLSIISWKYILRPITKRIPQKTLFNSLKKIVPFFIPLSKFFRIIGGRFGAKLFPIIEYSHLGLNKKLNQSWAILDTFDMYSPAHDHPQSITTVQNWFKQAGFINIVVSLGPNGIIGRGQKPL